MRVLVVEDDAALAAVIARGLREASYAVDVATDGTSAVYQVAVNAYDAIVLDVMLPGQDGFGVCRELRARLRALLRRGAMVLPELLYVGDIRIDTAGQRVTRGEVRVPLTTKEYALLEYLARHTGHVVGREELCAHVWDENHDPWSNAIEVCVARVRRKLEAVGARAQIQTRRGAGYTFAEGDSYVV